MKAVRDGDVFVYVGSNSKMVGEFFRDAYEIELLSGIELRRRTKGSQMYEINSCLIVDSRECCH